MIIGTELSDTITPHWENAKEKFKCFWNENVSEHVRFFNFSSKIGPKFVFTTKEPTAFFIFP